MSAPWLAAAGLIGLGAVVLIATPRKAEAPDVPQVDAPQRIPLPTRREIQRIADVYADIRGLRNNNPGNIRHGDNWQGMAEQQKDRSFIQFVSPEWGIRALGKVLVNYERLHGLNTVQGIINRWAPPIENNTAAYVRHVAEKLGVRPDQRINVREHLLPLTKAIIQHENGIQPYSDQLINQGLALV